MEDKGHGDLVTDFARPIPFYVIAHMLGYPKEKIEQVLDWTDVNTHAGCGPEQVTEEVVDAFASFATSRDSSRKSCPGQDDPLNVWLGAEIDGERLTEDRLLTSTTSCSSAGARPRAARSVWGSRLRWSTPSSEFFLRKNLDDRQGSVRRDDPMACPLFSASNRDPGHSDAREDDPEGPGDHHALPCREQRPQGLREPAPLRYPPKARSHSPFESENTSVSGFTRDLNSESASRRS